MEGLQSRPTTRWEQVGPFGHVTMQAGVPYTAIEWVGERMDGVPPVAPSLFNPVGVCPGGAECLNNPFHEGCQECVNNP